MQDTMKILINDFLTDFAMRGYSFNTIKSYRQTLNVLEHIDPNTVTSSELMILLSNNRKISTVSARQAAIRTFFKWLKDNGVIKYNPAEGLGSIRQKKILPQPIPENDLKIILEYAKELYLIPRTYFYVLLDLRLGVNEGLSLDINNICWEKGQERIQINNKGAKKALPLNWNMLCTSNLKRLCQSQKSGPLFTTARKKRATYDWAYYWWSKLMKECSMRYAIHQLTCSHRFV
ncbi:MAG TPA: hypothetical protein DDZ91_11720 [Firmicutes bacterium]|nr:hypothetical protein [Bacillota bacterium]